MVTILVVENDLVNRNLIVWRLEYAGFRVLVADDGVRGVGLARSAQPDLILMDMGLPLLNGWQATHRLKRDPRTRHIPVIALTAFALNEERAAALAAGCDAFETKPIDFDRLVETIRQLAQEQS